MNEPEQNDVEREVNDHEVLATEAGQAIVTQGLGGEGFFVVVSGRAEAIRQRADGAKLVVNTFGPTDFFGELALLDDGLRTATVVTTEPTKCLVLTRWPGARSQTSLPCRRC